MNVLTKSYSRAILRTSFYKNKKAQKHIDNSKSWPSYLTESR